MGLVRFSVSIDKFLVEKFDKVIKLEKYNNRSKAISDLINSYLVEKKVSVGDNVKIAGAVILVYDHHKRCLTEKLTDIQHDFTDIIISTQHVHLTHSKCLEIITVKGMYKNIKNLYNKLKAVKGVLNSRLIIAD